jgi:hypothetical protein
MAAQAETTVKRFHSPDGDMALQSKERFRGAETFRRNKNLALQALARLKRFSGNAIESFAAEIFGSAFNWKFAGLPKQTHRPMHCNALSFAAITR